jgi:hypothetical protein
MLHSKAKKKSEIHLELKYSPNDLRPSRLRSTHFVRTHFVRIRFANVHIRSLVRYRSHSLRFTQLSKHSLQFIVNNNYP